ncbi:MAG: MBL fold metallo-hydrolase, partial [Candidatus Aenigmarchaeota archaeon]|nr:MBL fold metallo-hydrolase [Candidatus Aenigmarchaeota archaeon]
MFWREPLDEPQWKEALQGWRKKCEERGPIGAKKILEHTQKVVPGVLAIYGEEITAPCSNIYLLESDKGILMIDSGDGMLDLRGLLRELQGFERPALVLLTHANYDHTFGVEGGWEVLMHPGDFKTGWTYYKPPGVFPLGEGTIRWGRFELEIWHTPGHTEGSVCIFEKNYRILFSGDALFPGGAHGKTNLPGGNREQTDQTMERLRRVEYNFLCAGHWGIER